MFDDIRPYSDDEVVAVIKRIIDEKEFQLSVASFILPNIYRLLPVPARIITKIFLKIRARRFTCVATLQQEMSRYLLGLIKKSTDGFSFSGLDKLELSRPTLFISNHRDIVLDPALVNLALSKSGTHTAEVAIGDNLLSKSWISDLMRLNKSFIVRRSERSRRSIMATSRKLSAYIYNTLVEKQQHIWIAQREGRAKDGLDKTNSALISMLLLNKREDQSITEYLNLVNIVPVSISYEFDPCDRNKAKELAAVDINGCYQKSEYEDIQSITQGLIGHKGSVHIEFGQPLRGEFKDSKAIAEAIDKQIISNYKLSENNRAAYAHLENFEVEKKVWHLLKDRMKGLDEVQQKWFIAMYANPVFAKKSLSLEKYS